MKTANEINEDYEKWRGHRLHDRYMMRVICEQAIGITERIEAMEQPPKVAWVAPIVNRDRAEPTQKDAGQTAMIKALRWACLGCSDSHHGCPSIGDECHIRKAIERLENGGEL